jgi:hypothetical protein
MLKKCLFSIVGYARDYVSQPFSHNGNIIVLYVLIFKLLEGYIGNKSIWIE